MKFGMPVLIGMALILLIGLISWFLPQVQQGLWVWIWVLNVLLLLAAFGALSMSLGENRGFWSFLVDERNMVSLSRFQIVIWTILILSSFATIAIARSADAQDNPAVYACATMLAAGDTTPCAAPAGVALPQILWALMGISVTSSVAAPLIKENKKQRTVQEQTLYEDMLADVVSGTPDKKEFRTVGAVVVRDKSEPPKFSDMFKGESPDNVIFVDMAKVQNFFFTAIALLVYAFSIGAMMSGARSLAELISFPDISQGLVALLGISHAGYLTTKAIGSTAAPQQSVSHNDRRPDIE